MYVLRAFATIVVCALLAAGALAQQANLEPNASGDKPAPTVGFELSFPGATPAYYSISVESSGRAAYRSDDAGPGTSANAGTPYTLKFTISEGTRALIFALTRQAKYFHGKFDYTKNRVANTGTKTLTYREGPADSPTTGVSTATTFNYSENPAIQQLTGIFQDISSSIELGRRLDYLLRFDRLGLEEELKHAEEMASQNRLLELQAIAPSLRAVADNASVMNVARQRAQHLLRLAQTPAAAR